LVTAWPLLLLFVLLLFVLLLFVLPLPTVTWGATGVTVVVDFLLLDFFELDFFVDFLVLDVVPEVESSLPEDVPSVVEVEFESVFVPEPSAAVLRAATVAPWARTLNPMTPTAATPATPVISARERCRSRSRLAAATRWEAGRICRFVMPTPSARFLSA
jgi:hypothetical protein